MTKSAYLAGFDVFYPDAVERAERMKALCAAVGIRGMFPADVSIDPTGLSPSELSAAIFRRDAQLVDDCDIVVANLNPFRGAEPDSGTCFELGYGFARGKRLYGYTAVEQTMTERVTMHFGETGADASGRSVDAGGLLIEQFGPPINLMISVPTTIVYGSFEDCIRRVAADLA